MIQLKEFEYQDSYNYVGEQYRTQIVTCDNSELIYFIPELNCVKYKEIEFGNEILIPINKVMNMVIK